MSANAGGGEPTSLLGGDGTVAAPAAAPGAAPAAAAVPAPAGAVDKGAAAPADKGAAAVAPTADEQRAFLTSKGGKAEELSKLSETDLKKAFDEAKAADAKPAGAPEKYEAFKMPKGVELDKELGGELEGVARALNLPQNAAQKVADLGAKLVQKMNTAHEAAVAEVRRGWIASSQGDKEIGGEKLQENLALARKVRDTFFTPEFRKFVNETGLGDHPELIRGFYRLGKAMSNDTFVPGGKQPGDTKTLAEQLYGSAGTKS